MWISSNLGVQNLQNGHKGTQYQNESTAMLGSPAARRYHEVSPIQNNKTSRRGWQSPNQEPPVSPKSDHNAYQQHVIHHTPPPNLATFSSSSSSPKSITSKNHSQTVDSKLVAVQRNQYSKSVDSHTMFSVKDKSDYRKSNISSTSSSGVASMSTSSYSNHNNNHNINNNNNNNNGFDPSGTLNYSTPNSSSNELLDESHLRRLSANKAAYESIRLTSSSSSTSSVHAIQTQRPKSAPFENHYGKIQQPVQHKSYDHCNGNRLGSDNNCNNSLPHAKTNGGHPVVHHQTMNARNNNIITNGSGKVAPPVVNGGIRTISNRGYANTNKIQQSFATLGATYYHHNHHQIQQQQMLAPHGLSSPESAYSTGYSTGYSDTSPGGCSINNATAVANSINNNATPEYYINIRTGTHYFPKSINPMGIESNNRFKCGLNRIEEKHVEFIADDKGHYENYKKQTEVCDVAYNNKNNKKNSSFSANKTTSGNNQLQQIDNNRINHVGGGVVGGGVAGVQQAVPQNVTPPRGMSPILPKSNNGQSNHFRSIESPSPRQRCRIRTNPWFITADTEARPNDNFDPKKCDMDTASTSSGIKSNSDGPEEKNDFKNGIHLSDSESSTSTEKNMSRKSGLNSSSIRSVIPRKPTPQNSSVRSVTLTQDSDEDATLNEMMGKFDESYVYEKETDILSDSDPTDCASDLDTGQDAGDECDTDDLLDLDYIDTGSVQEVAKDANKNTGSCSYHPATSTEKRGSRSKKSGKKAPEEAGPKRRKKLTRKKKNSESHAGRTTRPASRGCRSVGGTPVCLRRHQSNGGDQPIANRSNSLTFTEIHSIHSRLLAISESEKALLKADLEADVKYKQLIHEAETILVSMKTNAAASNKDAPIISPRRLCQIPTNKRVEMLRNCEADLKREIAKTQAQNGRSAEPCDNLNPAEGFIVNKRLEILRYETVSAPNSPKTSRTAAPLKTHVTNFIHQNVDPADILRKTQNTAIMSPKPQHNGHHVTHKPPKSPVPFRRRFRSQSPRHQNIPSDSDSAEEKNQRRSSSRRDRNKENGHEVQIPLQMPKPPLISFRSVDIGNNIPEDLYCPQSEPLKRKIYAGSSTYDRIQRTLDVESEIPKRALLNKISLMRRERQAAKTIIETTSTTTTHFYQRHQPTQSHTNDVPDTSDTCENYDKILTTIADIKQSLVDQSLELNECVNESDN